MSSDSHLTSMGHHGSDALETEMPTAPFHSKARRFHAVEDCRYASVREHRFHTHQPPANELAVHRPRLFNHDLRPTCAGFEPVLSHALNMHACQYRLRPLYVLYAGDQGAFQLEQIYFILVS